MEFTSPEAQERYAALVRALPQVVVGLDFDGTLSPIVEDPTAARIHPEAAPVLRALAAEVRALAVVTGRPARQAIALGDLDEVGTALREAGTELYVFGQYGNERWSASRRRIVSPQPPHGLATFLRELPGVLREADAADAWVEEKGLAVAVHTRRLPEPGEAQRRLTAPLTALAERHDLAIEPGRHVLEVRAPGMHKGIAVRTVVEEVEAGGILFAGDDLGDLEAFEAVAELREEGLATLLVCSASEEQVALVERADVVVDGPDGVLELLRRLTADAAAARG
ncbi:trehalose-phosphatase [Nocardioides perillae]|uniref:Trehalose 6-phosphate phosphatase n=1 Tax=Nocardioides perillae TaxID=1119534 RepID=A0A7Y9ULY1_9ACTN|nr:trehalose-phosphatase [Nocardioides perillae]NYG54836.1 trehalose 6-phosphate phosphatase [Nocardioides perillae]